MPHILIILGSTRDGRRGEGVARWVAESAKARSDFTWELADIKTFDLPFFERFEEPGEATFQPQGAAVEWSKKIAAADGFIFVTPEYNHGYPAPLKNAMDHLYREWNKKPAAFVSYGGSAGGARSVEQLRQVVVDLDMVPLNAAIHIVRVRSALNENGEPMETHYAKGLSSLFDKLAWWSEALKAARAKA